MFNIKNFVNTKDKKRLVGNFFSLSFLQIANYIFPLITLPYLVRVLGPSKYGLVAFAQAFVGYFQVLTNYGFGLSATKEISIHRDNEEKVSEVFSSVIAIQLFLAVLSFIIMLAIVFIFKKFSKDWLLYFFSFGLVIGNVLFPVWFFQGIEKMRYITILNVISKFIFTAAIFMFIRVKADYLYVPLISAIGVILSGIFGFWIIFKSIKVKFKLPKFINIKYQLKEGWHIFISTVAISLYTISNTFILGLFASSEIVGYYAAAEKIMKAIQGLLGPVSQSVYPHISKLVSESKDRAMSFIRKLLYIIGGFSFLLSLIIFIFAPLIVHIIFGGKYLHSIIILRIIAFLPFIIALSNVFGIQTMLNFGYKKAFSNILIIASIINITLSFILVPMFYGIGTSVAVLISEIFVTLSMFIYLNIKGFNFIKVGVHV